MVLPPPPWVVWCVTPGAGTESPGYLDAIVNVVQLQFKQGEPYGQNLLDILKEKKQAPAQLPTMEMVNACVEAKRLALAPATLKSYKDTWKALARCYPDLPQLQK